MDPCGDYDVMFFTSLKVTLIINEILAIKNGVYRFNFAFDKKHLSYLSLGIGYSDVYERTRLD